MELARRAAGSNPDSEYGAELEQIADEVAADRESLERAMKLLEVKPSPIKDAAGWTAEKFGRLKPNNSLLSYSPLSRVIELEGLVIGVTGKLALGRPCARSSASGSRSSTSARSPTAPSTSGPGSRICA